MTHSLPGRLATAMVPLLLAAGCSRPQTMTPTAAHAAQPAAARTTPQTTTPVVTDTQTSAFLVDRYGPSASLRDSWVSDHHDTLRVCADGNVVSDTAQRLLAVCTTLKRADFDSNGRIDLFALASKDGKAAPLAEARGLAFWFSGGPAQVKIARIGRQRHAFDILARVPDEYGELQQRTWYIARNGDFANALTLPAHYASDGRAWCRYAETTTCEGPATDIRYDLRIDARDADADAYPVAVETRGIRCDMPLDTASTLLDFDAGTLTYRAPKTLHAPTTDCKLDAR